MKTSTAFISSNAFRKGAFVALACAAIARAKGSDSVAQR